MNITLALPSLYLFLVACCWGQAVPTAALSKQWSCHSGDAFVTIRATVGPKTDSPTVALSLDSERDSVVSAEEEAICLRTVMRDFAKAGLEPSALTLINLRIQEPDVSRTLARACAELPRCIVAVRARKANQMVADLLSSTRAYAAFDTVLREFGLRIANIGGIENIRVEKLSKLHIFRHDNSLPGDVLVPVSANINIVVVTSAV